MKLCSRVFPLELECLKTLDTPCSVSFSFFAFSFFGTCELCCRNEKQNGEKGRMDSTHRHAGRGLNILSSARFIRAVTLLGSGYLQVKILSVLGCMRFLSRELVLAKISALLTRVVG